MSEGSIADALITRGWIQEREWDEEGHVCLDGAILVAAGAVTLPRSFFDLTDTQRDAVNLGRAIIGELLHSPEVTLVMSNGTVQHNVAGWNDCTTRTFDEVLRVAKEADEIITELKNSALQ